MNAITALQHRLQAINDSVLADPLPDLAEEMARTTQRLRVEFGDISRGAADQRGIAVAVATYLRTHNLPDSYRDLKYLCFGAASEYGAPLTRLIEESPLFDALLDTVESLTGEPRKLRRCYQGLLKTYFRYPGHRNDAKGRANWLRLREFLSRHCTTLQKQQPVLAWTQSLHEHRNLLGDNPCQRYGKTLLDGDNSPIEELRERLGIDDDTWVMQELILAPIEAATELDDDSFRPRVIDLTQRLEGHPLLASRGLAALLKRYHRCETRPEHHTLRDAALREWKSPWLESNRPLWHAQIGAEATEMVSLWLKKRTIQDFFELLQADGQADRQRMEFWLKYAEFMEEIWLALGSNSLTNNRADYRRIRQQMEGRRMELEGPGKSDDNAFIMKIGDYVFIEFGKHSNACHVFDASNLPFRPRQKSVLGTKQGLKNDKHPGHRGKMTHHGTWQWDFARFLSSYAGAEPGKEPGRRQTLARPAPRREAPINEPLLRPAPADSIDVAELTAFCAIHGHKVVDLRDKGGAVWVVGSGFNSDVINFLRRAGFRYKGGKGWWLA